MTFKEIQDEVKRGAIRDQGGTTFDDGIKNIINRSIFRLNRETPWRSMRRRTYLTTNATYSTGSGAVAATNGSKNVTVTGATFLTDGIVIGRRIKISGSATFYIIRQITGETTLVLDKNYGGTTTTSGTYSVLGQEEYNMPIQAGHRMFMWHEEYGYPYLMHFWTDQEFYDWGVHVTEEAIPIGYRMWGADMAVEQIRTPSVITISSSSSDDKNIEVTVFGIVSGYPDFETITTNSTDGTTTVAGSKSFSSVERVVKGSTTVGRITATANSAATTVAVLPVGDITTGIVYRKIQLYPLPNTQFDINVQYYKDAYKLVNDGDVHEMGEDFDQAIIFLSTAILKYENGQQEGDKFMDLFRGELRTLRRVNMDKIDWFARLRRPKHSRDTLSDLRVHPYLSYKQVGSYYGPVTGGRG